MYTDEDLEHAVKQGIFSGESVERFRHEMLRDRNTHTADEENFRLVASFNDIFVVLACGLLLLSSSWMTYSIHPAVSAGLVAVLSWGLAEFFVLIRKMALPAIFLLATFVSSLFIAIMMLFQQQSEVSVMVAAVGGVFGAFLHWKRFAVPITVAAGAIGIVIFLVSLLMYFVPQLREHINKIIFLAGIAVFATALWWDAGDLERVTRKTDVAFWLHLISAPLIVHPIFVSLSGAENLSGLLIIILFYVFLTLTSLTIDRRAFMVSALVYVVIALTKIFESYGVAGDSFAYVGVIIGFSLLLLSGFWHRARKVVLMVLPGVIKRLVPPVV